jgi:hypothetical protein
MRRGTARTLAASLLAGALTLAPVAVGGAAASAPAFGASALGAAVVATTASDDDGSSGGQLLVTVPDRGQGVGDAVDDAQFRWGMNAEAGAGAFAGGCNFLSAGRAGDIGGGGVVWTEQRGFYRATDGDVRIEKPTATGEYDIATFAGRCLDATGTPVTASSITSQTGNQVVIDGGTGTRSADGSLEIRWTGSFTVVFYGGMTYWSASDPVLTLDASGNGRVTAVASGFAASMEDLNAWKPLPERQIVLAEVRDVDTSGGDGFVTDPQYLGVAVADAGQVARTADNAAFWGSFPASFVQYQKLTGQAGYWLTTNGQRDRAKIASTLYISYDADTPVTVVPPASGSSGSGATPQNRVVQRPAAAAVAGPVVPASVPVFALADASTVVPQGEGLVPGGASGSTSPLVLPLLGTALALCAAIVAVLNLMQALPWQRAARAAPAT